VSRIARVTQTIFASTPGAQQVSQFGSWAAGSQVFTTSIATIQALSNWATGWFAARIGAGNPPIQDMNAFGLVVTQQLANVFQDGVPLYDAATTYYKGSIVQGGTGLGYGAQGLLYMSQADTNLGNDLRNTTYWLQIANPNAPQVIIGSAPYCTHADIPTALADANVGTNIRVVLATSFTMPNSAYTLTKAGWKMTAMPGVTVTSGGSSSKFMIEAANISLTEVRFSGFSTSGAIGFNSSGTYARIRDCNFNNCTTTPVDISAAPSGSSAPIEEGSFVE
jgi:hypothetical protein